jgi:hypothetical protein
MGYKSCKYCSQEKKFWKCKIRTKSVPLSPEASKGHPTKSKKGRLKITDPIKKQNKTKQILHYQGWLPAWMFLMGYTATPTPQKNLN